jgi:hypothetical protein
MIYKLKLPKDVLDIICSFNFYSFEQCIDRVKQKYKHVMDYIKVTVYESNYYPTTIFYATIIRIESMLLFIHICKHCGNYLISMPYSCRCKLSFNGVYHVIQ